MKEKKYCYLCMKIGKVTEVVLSIRKLMTCNIEQFDCSVHGKFTTYQYSTVSKKDIKDFLKHQEKLVNELRYSLELKSP